MRLLAVVVLVVLALALADARAPRKVQRRVQPVMFARRMMNNRRVGGRPMTMKRLAYNAVAQRAVVNASFLGKNDTGYGKNESFVGKNETFPGKNATFFGKNDTVHGKNATVDGGRGNSTDGGDKVDKALNNVYESFEALDDSVSILEDLGWACTDYSAYKRDSAAKKNNEYIANFLDDTADAAYKLKEKVDGLTELYFWLKCDHEVFCDNLEYTLVQEYYYLDEDELTDVQEVYEAVCVKQK